MFYDTIKVMNAWGLEKWHTFDRFFFRGMVVGGDGERPIQTVIAGLHVVSVRRAMKMG